MVLSKKRKPLRCFLPLNKLIVKTTKLQGNVVSIPGYYLMMLPDSGVKVFDFVGSPRKDTQCVVTLIH